MSDDDMVDMDEERTTPIVRPRMEDLNQFFRQQDYTRYSPQAVSMMFALLRQYDPSNPPERRVQYCQMQFSHLPDGGGTSNTAQRRVLTHAGDRLIGHNLVDKHFRDVATNERIKLTDPGGYPLPLTSQEERLLSQAEVRGVGVFADTQPSAGQGTADDTALEDTEITQAPAAIAAVPTATTTEVDEVIREMMEGETITTDTQVAISSDTAEQGGGTVAPQARVVAESHQAERNTTMVVTIERATESRSVVGPSDQPRETTTGVMRVAESDVVSQPPTILQDVEMIGASSPNVSQAQDPSVDVVEVHPVTDDSDEDLPMITFATPKVISKRGRQALTGSSSSLDAPPPTRRRQSSSSSVGVRSVSRGRRSVHERLGPLSDAAANRERSQSRASNQSQQPDLDVQGDEFCRLIDETLLELSQDIRVRDADLPYPRNSDVPAEQLLDEDDTFFAGKVLEYCDVDHTSPILAVGDNMFHKLHFGERSDMGGAGKVSFGGGRISEIYLYLQESGTVKREIVILCMGTNDILKRKRHPHNMTVEKIFELYVAFIEWFSTKSNPEVIFLCTLVPVPPEKFPWYNREAEQLNGYLRAYVNRNENTVLIDIYSRMCDEIVDKWDEYYETPGLLHPNRERGHPIIHDLINNAVDFYVQDKQEIICSSRLNTTEPLDDYFRGTYISDPHNIFRRKFRKLRQRGQMNLEQVVPRVNLEPIKNSEDALAEPWHQGVRGMPPYIAEYEADCPKEPAQFTKESSRVKFLAGVFMEKFNRKAARDTGVMTRDAAEDLIYNKLTSERKKAPATYSMKAVFGSKFLATKPVGVRHGALDPEEVAWEDLPESEIIEEPKPDQSDLLIDSRHDAIVAALRPMSGTRYLRKEQKYPSDIDRVLSLTRYHNDFGTSRLINSLAWYTLRELRGKKILIVSDSTINPLIHFPYLHKDVALISMPQSTLQQRAALVLALSELLDQVTPIVVMLGFIDHLDLNGDYKSLRDPTVGTEDIAKAVTNLYEGCREAKTALKNEWRRTVFVAGPGFKQWPAALQKVTAVVALMYREIEATTCGGMMTVDKELRPARMDYPRLMSEVSKTVSAMPLLEAVELTVDDCVLREHNDYLRLIQPKDESGNPVEISETTMKQIERSMRIMGDKLCTRSDGEQRYSTRVSLENVDKINRVYQECRHEHKKRVPKHNIVTEIKTYDEFHDQRGVFNGAPLGVALFRLAMQKELRMNLTAGMCAGAAEEKMGSITLRTLVEENKFPGMDEVTKMMAELGVGWVKEFLHDALRMSPAEIAEIQRLIARLTVSQIFALIGAFGMQAFVYGPAVLFQESWKRQSLQQTLMIMIITMVRVNELLDI